MNIENRISEEKNSQWKARSETNAEKSEKQLQWDKISNEIDQITDGLGKGIDQGIKESVIAMTAYDFPTDQSCEGHSEEEHGLPYPWVRIYAPEPDGWKESEEKQKEWSKDNRIEQQRMLDLLSEFYENRNAPLDARLVFNGVGAFGGFNVQSMGAETMQLLDKEKMNEKATLYKKEMDDFTAFLKDKFFQS